MTTRWFGARVQRVEDDRLLRGRGHFTDDIDEGALESVLVRSPFAHARIKSIDVSAARAVPGVKAVYVAADLPFGHTDLPILIPHPNLTHGRTQRCLASEVVRYTGEAVAFVVAENRYIAEDAADLVQVEYEPLPVVITPEVAAVAEHLVHADVPGNVAAEMLQEAGDVKSALAAAPHRKQLHLRFERGAASPMEGRAVWARWSEAEHRLTVFDSTQSPTSIRGGLAVLFGLPESDRDPRRRAITTPGGTNDHLALQAPVPAGEDRRGNRGALGSGRPVPGDRGRDQLRHRSGYHQPEHADRHRGVRR